LLFIKTLEQFDFTWPARINRSQVHDLFCLEFVQDKGNAIFIAGVGLGKTPQGIALGYRAALAEGTTAQSPAHFHPASFTVYTPPPAARKSADQAGPCNLPACGNNTRRSAQAALAVSSHAILR
jgi:hypothetical protein